MDSIPKRPHGQKLCHWHVKKIYNTIMPLTNRWLKEQSPLSNSDFRILFASCLMDFNGKMSNCADLDTYHTVPYATSTVSEPGVPDRKNIAAWMKVKSTSATRDVVTSWWVFLPPLNKKDAQSNWIISPRFRGTKF